MLNSNNNYKQPRNDSRIDLSMLNRFVPSTKLHNSLVGHRWRIWPSAAILTLLIHVGVVGPAFLGNGRESDDDSFNEGSPTGVHTEKRPEFISLMIFANDSSITRSQDSLATNSRPEAAREMIPIEALLQKNNHDVVIEIADERESSLTQSSRENDPATAALFGMYVNQVTARIERAWEVPTDAAQTRFQCVVEIQQAENGAVEQIVLQECSSDEPAWQLSLVQAIQRASPLSAPPNRNVFSRILTVRLGT